MLFHVWTLVKNNLRSNLLLVAGLFVIATSLWYAVDYVYAVAVNQQIPLGFDWKHVYYAQVGVLPEESAECDTASRTGEAVTEEYLTFYERIQRHPSVESACYTNLHFHYVWKNALLTLSLDTLQKRFYYRYVTPSYFTVFRVKGADGCSPEELTRRAVPGELVVSEKGAGYLLSPDDSRATRKGTELAGKFVTSHDYDRNDTLRVAAVCEEQKYNEYTAAQPAAYQILQFGRGWTIDYQEVPYIDLFFRVRAEADRPGFTEAFRKEMKRSLRVGNLYLADLRPMSAFREVHLADYRSDLYAYLAIAGFFLANAFLAVLGTFWFRTQQRREELAIRLVTGATKRNLQTLLLGEGFLLVTLAYLPALVLAFHLGAADLVTTYPVKWSVGRFFAGGALTYLLLLAVTAVSIAFPARQAMKLRPAEALHGE